MLRALLALRGAFNIVFGVALLAWVEVAAPHGYARGGWYGVVDGVLAVALAGALARSHARWLTLLALADGLVRLVLGALILANPGLERMPVGQIVFFTAVIAACFLLGLGGVLYVLIARRHAPGGAVSGPALAISACTMLLAVGLAFGFLEAEKRVMLAVYAIAVGAALAWAAARRR